LAAWHVAYCWQRGQWNIDIEEDGVGRSKKGANFEELIERLFSEVLTRLGCCQSARADGYNGFRDEVNELQMLVSEDFPKREFIKDVTIEAKFPCIVLVDFLGFDTPAFTSRRNSR